MNSEQDTLPNLQTVLDALNKFREETKQQIDGLREDVDRRFDRQDGKFEDMRLQLMSFDVRIDRLEAMSHELLHIAFNSRADVKVLREEVAAWSRDVYNLQKKVA